MRKLIILFSLLFLSLGVFAQGPGVIGPIASSGGGGAAYEVPYQAVLDTTTNRGGLLPSESQRASYNTFVKYLVDNGYWVRTKWMEVSRTPYNGVGQALMNWITPGTNDATNNGAIFTANSGLGGNGSSFFVNSNFNIEVDSGTVVGRNNFTILMDLNDDITEGVYVVGAEVGSIFIRMAVRFTGPNTFRSTINNGTALSSLSDATNGLAGITRTSSTATEQFFDGASKGTDTSTSTDTPNQPIYFLAMNDDGTADNFSTNEYGLGMIIDGLTLSEYQDINTAWATCKAGL